MQRIALKQGESFCFYANRGGHVFVNSGKLRISQPLRWAEGLPLRHDCSLEGEQMLQLEHEGWTWLDAISPCLLDYAEQAKPVRRGWGEHLLQLWQGAAKFSADLTARQL